MKPYYRYNVPQRDILSSELDLWNLLSKSQIQKEHLLDRLKVFYFIYMLKLVYFLAT
jgi:hypothetical protein